MLATTVATRRTGGEGPVGMSGGGGLSTISGASLLEPSALPVSDVFMGYYQSKSTLDLCEQRHAPYIRDRRASQGPLGRVAPSGGARQGPIAGYVLQSAAPAGPSP